MIYERNGCWTTDKIIDCCFGSVCVFRFYPLKYFGDKSNLTFCWKTQSLLLLDINACKVQAVSGDRVSTVLPPQFCLGLLLCWKRLCTCGFEWRSRIVCFRHKSSLILCVDPELSSSFTSVRGTVLSSGRVLNTEVIMCYGNEYVTVREEFQTPNRWRGFLYQKCVWTCVFEQKYCS